MFRALYYSLLDHKGSDAYRPEWAPERHGGLTRKQAVELLVHHCLVRTRRDGRGMYPYGFGLTAGEKDCPL